MILHFGRELAIQMQNPTEHRHSSLRGIMVDKFLEYSNHRSEISVEVLTLCGYQFEQSLIYICGASGDLLLTFCKNVDPMRTEAGENLLRLS